MKTATLRLTDDRWNALVARDAEQDGHFVYAVTTTGIYCRPSCAARTPKRGNVVLFAVPADAERAEFRACRRCRPDADTTPVVARVQHARKLIDDRLDTDPDCQITLAELAGIVGCSPSHLQRTFSRIIGLSPRAYVDARRIERAKTTLRNGATVLSATLEGGFGSGKALYERADEAFGMTPGAYRRGGAGLTVRYALFDTALGIVLVAATKHGVCAVSLDDEAEKLTDELHRDLHAAEVARDDAGIGPWAEPILRFLAGSPDGSLTATARDLLLLPLDVRGTAFQRRVWSALRRIPVGETRTYGDVAKLIGRPTASRAVAQACGSNRVSLVVPCHRVVGAAGNLRGYRWGLERKRRLLELETESA